MKFDSTMRQNFEQGLNGLLRMDGGAYAYFAGTRLAVFSALIVVVFLSELVFLCLSLFSAAIADGSMELSRVALGEICQYLVIIIIIQAAAERWGREALWPRCATAILFATALTNLFLIFGVLAGSALIEILMNDASQARRALSGVPVTLSIYLIIVMCRVLRAGLKIQWRQVAAIMLLSLVASVFVVQVGTRLNHNLSRPIAMAGPGETQGTVNQRRALYHVISKVFPGNPP